ncbi:general secretion pathway protein F [Singulisphaera sp. GP187]|uniref:type II secretion system F family protein n=1 Tax=Singulisphaera sp. GP187 TaxID=1882752 RepID=UPI0009260B3D|nr:type II secretion system F family protein [Singulisphaera sp. GP187]SIO07934.1 general secretion pathway protein F [Singulisphaera sp. GP187]
MTKPSEETNGSHGRLSSDDVAQLTGHIASLTSAGMPLASGVRALAEEIPSRRLRAVLNRLADQLESGASLETAIERQGDRLPPHLRGLVVAGTRSGKLGDVLGRFAGYANIGSDLRRSLWLRLAYPTFTIALAVVVFVFVCVVLVTGFSRIFQDFGMPIPVLTGIVFQVAKAVDRAWLPLLQGLIGLAVLGVIASLVLRTDVRRSLAWVIPLIGPVWHLSDLAEFSHLLALLLESEVPLREALPMAGAAVRNSEIASGTKQAAQEIAEGRSLALALTRPSLFPHGFARIIDWAEKHRGMPEALHMAGEMFEAQARSQASFVSTVCGILAIWSILCGIVVVVVAIFFPLISLINRLSG